MSEVKALRRRLGLTRPELAQLIGVTTRSVERWEQSGTEPRKYDVRKRLRELWDRKPLTADNIKEMLQSIMSRMNDRNLDECLNEIKRIKLKTVAPDKNPFDNETLEQKYKKNNDKLYTAVISSLNQASRTKQDLIASLPDDIRTAITNDRVGGLLRRLRNNKIISCKKVYCANKDGGTRYFWALTEKACQTEPTLVR